jgi:hypothetical protein
MSSGENGAGRDQGTSTQRRSSNRRQMEQKASLIRELVWSENKSNPESRLSITKSKILSYVAISPLTILRVLCALADLSGLTEGCLNSQNLGYS